MKARAWVQMIKTWFGRGAVAFVFTLAFPMLAHGQAANMSCNGRFNESTFFSTGTNIYIHGGQTEAGEVIDFSIKSGTFQSLEVKRIEQGGGRTSLCTGLACDGLSETASATGNLQFEITGRAATDQAVFRSQCTPNSTGPDDDGDDDPDTPDDPDDPETPDDPDEPGDDDPVEIGKKLRARLIAARVDAILASLDSAGSPIWELAAIPDVILEIAGLRAGPVSVNLAQAGQGIDLSVSTLNAANGQGPELPVHLWMTVRFTALHGDDAGLDGPMWHGRIGAGYKLTNRLSIGAFGSFRHADVEADPLGVELEEHRFGGGAYVKGALSDHITLMAMGYGEGGEVDIESLGASGSADVHRFVFSGMVSGLWREGALVINPRLSASIARNVREGYTDTLLTPIPKSANTEGFGSAGIKLALEPKDAALGAFVDLAGELYSQSFEGVTTTSGATLDESKLSGRFEGGFKLRLGQAGSLQLSGGASGVGRDTIGVFGSGALSLHF